MPRDVQRESYRLEARPEPGVDGIRALQAWLKVGLRTYGLRCIRGGVPVNDLPPVVPNSIGVRRCTGQHRAAPAYGAGGSTPPTEGTS